MERNYSRTVAVLHGDRVLAKFTRTPKAGKNACANPESLAKDFLGEILNDESHELHEALMNGEITTIGGEETVRRPRQTVTL